MCDIVGDMTNIASLPHVPDDRRRVARAVKAHLVVSNTTPTRMASKIGMSQSAMSRRTSGLQPFDVDELSAIAAELKTSLLELVQMPKDDSLDYGGDVSEAQVIDLSSARARKVKHPAFGG